MVSRKIANSSSNNLDFNKILLNYYDKKSILIENKTSITTKNSQLVILSEILESNISIEDIGILVLDHQEIYLSIPAMNLLVENNTA